MDDLIKHLIEVNTEFKKQSVPFLLGGGMGLYIRTTHGRPQGTPRYPFQIEARATADFDIFLNAETIVSKDQIEKVKAILKNFSYTVVEGAKFFQFERTIEVSGVTKVFRIDFLSAPITPENSSKVKKSAPRIKPKGVEGFHAYETREAEGLELGVEKIKVHESEILVISPFNYLIFKLHAFNDRKDKKDPKSNEGRHHAWDIFTTIARMNEDDWKNALNHKKVHEDKEYLIEAQNIQKSYFSQKDLKGNFRMREYETYVKNRETYDVHFEKIVSDLTELFK